MSAVCGPEGELLQEDGLGKARARLKALPKIEDESDIGVLPFLVVCGIFDGENVEGNHNTVDGHQHSFPFLVNL